MLTKLGFFTDRVRGAQAGQAKRNRNKWMVRWEAGLCRSLLAESVNKPELCRENDEVLQPRLTKSEQLRMISACERLLNLVIRDNRVGR